MRHNVLVNVYFIQNQACFTQLFSWMDELSVLLFFMRRIYERQDVLCWKFWKYSPRRSYKLFRSIKFEIQWKNKSLAIPGWGDLPLWIWPISISCPIMFCKTIEGRLKVMTPCIKWSLFRKLPISMTISVWQGCWSSGNKLLNFTKNGIM